MRKTITEDLAKLYWVLLFLCPLRFREAYGKEMTELFRRRLERTAHARGRLYCCTSGIFDLLLTAFLQRFTEMRASTADRSSIEKGDPLIYRLRQNVRLALRSMRRSPGFTAAVLATLALGTGTTIAMFAVMDATIIRPLPYPDSESLVAVSSVDPRFGPGAFGPPYLQDLRERIHGLDRIAGYSPSWEHTLTGVGEPTVVTAAYVTDGLFELMGATAVTGRTFLPDEYASGTHAVAVVSRAFWNRHFGSGVALNGQTIRLSDQPYTVVGILEKEFRLPVIDSPVNRNSQNAELWLPFSSNPYANLRTIPVMNVVGRLASEASIAAVNRELQSVAGSLAADYPETSKGLVIVADPLRRFVSRSIERTVLVLFAAVCCLLLIACVNVANLLLARGSARQYEFAVRRSLGATRQLVMEQLIVETFVIAVAGSLLGLLLASWAVSSIPALGLSGLPPTADIRIDLRVCGFASLIAIAVTVLFGSMPAFRTSRRSEESALRSGARGSRAGGAPLREALMVTEVALTLMLMVGAGLLARSFWKLSHVDPGFRPQDVLMVPISLPETVYETDDQRRNFFADVLGRLVHLPGAVAVAAVNRTPLSGATVLVPVEIEGQPERITVDRRVSTPGYFATLGIPVVDGRDFGSEDRPETERTGILNMAAARRFFPDGHAIGRRIRLILRSGPGPWVRIVGISGNVRHHGLDQPVEPEIYVPYSQAAVESMVVLLRRGIPSENIVPAVRSTVWDIDANLPLDGIRSLDTLVDASLEEPWIRMLFLNGFAGFALLLAAIGLYGVVSYGVARRQREIAIRLALGAQPGHLLQLVVRHGVLLAGIGVAIGLGASSVLTQVLSKLLFGVTPLDSITLIAVPAIVLLIGALASYIPARRATHFDPVEVLRAD